MSLLPLPAKIAPIVYLALAIVAALFAGEDWLLWAIAFFSGLFIGADCALRWEKD